MSAPRPIVAIIGRPNVGKSTLFNRLVGQRLAIVHDEPGVTRDRHYADASSLGRPYTLIDTGGFDPESSDRMQAAIVRQIGVALEEADVILCALDATLPLSSTDHAEIDLLRRTRKPVIYLANKCDSERQEAESSELYRLGMDYLHTVSALHGRGMSRLEHAIAQALDSLIQTQGEPLATGGAAATGEKKRSRGSAMPDPGPRPLARRGARARRKAEQELDSTQGEKTDVESLDAPLAAAEPLRVAVVGRPNSGKSSLINRLLGEERLLVHDAPGTTRDPIDTLIERGGQRFVFVDTAGLRRKSSVAKSRDTVEALSVLQGIRAIDRAEVVVLLCDAERGVDEQEAKIMGLAMDRGRALLIGLNKIDLLSPSGLREAVKRAREKLSFVPWAPIEKLSALTGDGTSRLLKAVGRVGASYVQRVSTGEVNRFFEEVLTSHPPPTQGGRAPRFYYVAQVETAPPLFVVQTSHPEYIHFSYQRYVINAIRKRFGFEGVPIRVSYKKPRRRGEG